MRAGRGAAPGTRTANVVVFASASGVPSLTTRREPPASASFMSNTLLRPWRLGRSMHAAARLRVSSAWMKGALGLRS